MGDLPTTTPEMIAQIQAEYTKAAAEGGDEAVEACIRLAWALAHSTRRADAARGAELAEALLHESVPSKREVEYIRAVATFRQRKFLEARRLLLALLAENPGFRQAQSLAEAAETEIVKDGLVGVGAGAAILAAVGAIAFAALRSK